MNWDMIEHLCVSIAVVGAALTYMYKGYKFAKKPADDFQDALETDSKKLKDLEDTCKHLLASNNLVIRTLFIILGELAVNNDADGRIKKAQENINEFLLNEADN